MNAYSSFSARFALHAERPFLTMGDGQSYRYADVERETAMLANHLLGLGLKKEDRVAAQVEKTPQALFLYLACLRAGLCYLPLNPAYQRDELAYFIADAEPALIVCSTQQESLFRSLGTAAHIRTLNEDASGSLSEGYRSAPANFKDVAMAQDDLAVLIYTSGTTGRSKGAMVTHGNLVSNAEALTTQWRISEDDVLVHALPLFHIHGLFVAIHPLMRAGARILFLPKFDSARVLQAISRATLLMGVPTFYTRLLQEPALNRDMLGAMRLFISGSAPLLKDTFEQWRARTGHTILERYGMSEAGMITSNPYEGERRGGTVGIPLPQVAVRVIDEQGKLLIPHQPGAVQIKGPNVFKGYWRMPDKTQEAFTADGWFKTGDMGQWDEAGYLSIVGRATDLIISGGFNVYPKEIELA
ncbi:MAG TPA: AMP-binding protein, partial [Burkholderiales bacterium]|nr:AMP-binding protein [Burkholderiales bacterium]